MIKDISKMTYKEFMNYCEERACDGKWDLMHATECINLIQDIQEVEVKILGVVCKKQTEKAREVVWKMVMRNHTEIE